METGILLKIMYLQYLHLRQLIDRIVMALELSSFDIIYVATFICNYNCNGREVNSIMKYRKVTHTSTLCTDSINYLV